MDFVARGKTATTPYVSLTRSYEVARGYAEVGRAGIATVDNPGYVYEIECSSSPRYLGFHLIDPIKEVARLLPSPLEPVPYQPIYIKTLEMALRDVEIVAYGSIPPSYVVARHSVY
jgi:hypothetical protein